MEPWVPWFLALVLLGPVWWALVTLIGGRKT
jgi:hypothetical protein